MVEYVVLADRLVAYEVAPRGMAGCRSFEEFSASAAEWRGSYVVTLYNNVATDQGLPLVKKFKDRETGLQRLWELAQGLPVLPRASKKETVLSLVQRPSGASLEELMGATGWQAHSVRGFLSTNRKDYEITLVDRPDDGKAYVATKREASGRS